MYARSLGSLSRRGFGPAGWSLRSPIARSQGVRLVRLGMLSGTVPVTTTVARRGDASPCGMTSRQPPLTISARISQSVNMRRPRSAGAVASTGT